MEITDCDIEIRLTIASTGALRVLLNQEIARIEQWIVVHGGSALPTVLRDIHGYLTQVHSLRDQVRAGWEAFVCNGAPRAVRMNGKRGERPSKHRTAANRGVPG